VKGFIPAKERTKMDTFEKIFGDKVPAFPQIEALVYSAAIAPWALQNKIDIESQEFTECIEDVLRIRDRILHAICDPPD
jgi:hypothetical protein